MARKNDDAHGRGQSGAIDATFAHHDIFVGTQKSDQHSSSSSQVTFAFGRGGSDRLTGGDLGDDLLGGARNDTLTGAAGPDHIDGGNGADTLLGGAEADTLMGGNGRDFLDEGAGHGDLEGGAGDDILVGGLGADAFVVSPDSGNDVITDFVAGPGMFDHLALMDIKPEDLRFEDTPEGVLISWAEGEGSVLLQSVSKQELAQDDFMFTDDRFLIEPTSIDADSVSAISFAKNEGGDFSAESPGRTTEATFTERFDDFNVKIGTGSDDTFQATARRDYYVGLDGNDKLFGGRGNDHLDGDAGNDILDGGDGQDDLRAGAGNDQLFGGDMADNLMGEAGNDVLMAGAGHDMLEGGEGDDVYNGGDGADAFIVAHGSGNDVVVGGFDAGPGAFDHIAFKDILPDEVSVADQNAGVLVSWGDGSIFIENMTTAQMSQDDFMFNAVEGGGFVDEPVQVAGTELIFQENLSTATTSDQDSLLA